MSSFAEAPASAPRISDDKLRLLFALLFASPEAVHLERIRQVLYPAAAEPVDGEADEVVEEFREFIDNVDPEDFAS